MLKIDALIDLFFTDMPFDKRVAEIAGCGYKYIETWKGGDAALLKSIADAGDDCGVSLVSIVMNFATEGDVAPVKKENLQAFVERMDKYSDNALGAGCHQGIVTTGQYLGRRSYQDQRAALIDAMRAAGEKVASKGFQLNLEVLNTQIDHPGYFLDSPIEGIAITKEISLSNVKMLYDIYHMGIMTGNITDFIEHNIKWIGHFHSAGIPGRHELFNGETNYPFIADRIQKSGYDAYFGLEYVPLLKSKETLVKTLEYLS